MPSESPASADHYRPMMSAAIIAREIALGPFGFDHPRTGISQPLRSQRSGHRLLLRHDEDALQRLGHQNDFGRPSAWVATWLRIRFVEIGAT